MKKSGGISIVGLLGILFVGLKLTGYIDWSWWWVLLPFYGGIVVVLGVFLFFYGLTAIIGNGLRR